MVIATVPAVLAGVLIALSLGGITLNVQSFMGAIVAIGVAVANAILLTTFAENHRLQGAAPQAAAIEGALVIVGRFQGEIDLGPESLVATAADDDAFVFALGL